MLVVILALLVTSAALAGKKKGFNGAWESIDNFDGSYQVMVIELANSYFMYYDFGASVCGTDFDVPLYASSFEGPPEVVGNEMTVEGKILCVADDPFYVDDGSGSPEIYSWVLTYDKNSDTISWFDTWSRI